MKIILALALAWLMPVQGFNCARIPSVQLLLKQTRIPLTVNHGHTPLSVAYVNSVKTMHPAYSFRQAKTHNISWFSKLKNSLNSLLKQFRQPLPQQPLPKKNNTHMNQLKRAATFSIGAGLGLYALQENRICFAAELSLNWDEIKDPVKLRNRIQNTPDNEKPALATEIINYLASYLDSYRWRWALSTAIRTYPEIAHIIVNFLIQYPSDITQNSKNCVPVVDFLMSNNKAVANSIIECVTTNKQTLENTTHGPSVIALINKHNTDS